MKPGWKIAVAVREDLEVWQKLNVACFLSGGLVGSSPEIAGEPYRDGSGTVYGPLIRQPIMVFEGTGADLIKVRERAMPRNLLISIYTHDLFTTGNDDDNRAAVEAEPEHRGTGSRHHGIIQRNAIGRGTGGSESALRAA